MLSGSDKFLCARRHWFSRAWNAGGTAGVDKWLANGSLENSYRWERRCLCVSSAAGCRRTGKGMGERTARQRPPCAPFRRFHQNPPSRQLCLWHGKRGL